MEFESSDKALEVLKKGKEIEIEGQKVKIVRTPPDHGNISRCFIPTCKFV